jgi:hypothetical protein
LNVNKPARLCNRALQNPSLSQDGLEFWLEQAIDFLAGRKSCFLIASVSFSKSKRSLQAPRQRTCRRPGVAPERLTKLAFEAPATAHWREARSPEADNIDAGPVTEADLYDNLFRPLDAPF